MSNPEAPCPFCDTPGIKRERRLIRSNGSKVLSLMSNPRFREFHSLVVPTEHVADLHELSPTALTEFMQEVALIKQAVKNAAQARVTQKTGDHVDVGSLVVIKPEPVPTEGNVSVPVHLHAHVYPFYRPNDAKIPAPTSDGDFLAVSTHTLKKERDAIRREILHLTSNPAN